MALTGLQIYKLLPASSTNPEVKAHANCKECGYPTCLAFAMKLAAKQADLSLCPYVEEESKRQLEESAAPPIRLITVAGSAKKLEVGNELVLHRHEKTFYHPPGLFVRVKDTQPDAAQVAKAVADYTVDYVGMSLSLDGVAVEAAGGDFGATVAAVKAACPFPLILMATDPATAEAGLKAAQGTTPLLWAASAENWQAMAQLAAQYKVPLAVLGPNGDLNALADLAEQVKNAGVEDLVLDPGTRDHASSLAAFTQLRRLALRKNERKVGYPLIAFAGDDITLAAQHIAKYAGFIVLDQFDPAMAYPLIVLRANLFTDPQKPIQVLPGVYEINHPGPSDPLMITTNFSITYFSVANEVESSGLPGWLLVADAEGMSVLTAWAAGKFDAERIAKTVKSTGIEQKINHKRLIIPGHVAVLLGEIEEELPGWEINVGPREAVDLPNYLKTRWG
ncbi:MAG: acetyl-CoA decarbonylase/synthase complex subunit gamma [Ardenticatenia bacterium]|jgi:acetyl-CoA decarbonylase/synthase complex subunit gamma|nr:MAG: acetyl-CoA decarbonylase/synthase complex subunit gamma [Ardenticatenia bacterium]